MKDGQRKRVTLLDRTYAWYFLLGAVAIYAAFFVLPSILSIFLSLTDWSITKWDYSFVGLKNYIEIFTKGNYLKYVGRTIWFSFATSVLKTAVGLLLALALNRGLRTQNLLRTLFYMPIIISPLIIGIIFKSIFHPNGLLNETLNALGLSAITNSWLTNSDTAFGAVMSVEVWRYIGFNMAIFMAGLQMIDKTYYEASEIDGASRLKQFWHITVPCLMPSITINIVLNVMNGLKVFDVVFTLTNGGPGDLTDVLNTVIFREYSKGRYGFSTALGVVLFVLTVVLAAGIYLPLSRKEVEQ